MILASLYKYICQIRRCILCYQIEDLHENKDFTTITSNLLNWNASEIQVAEVINNMINSSDHNQVFVTFDNQSSLIERSWYVHFIGNNKTLC